ncbi:MAG: glycerol-3-phosphate 1-O-acyltransferase PlsY [Chloroflexi bacterium]|nr:glycerol-3-phosphate 1-O-acyltransferase PlsY [Chloroflexota bacterium]
MTFWLLVPLCYLLGAVPFGLLVARLVRRIDVRQYGSGNTGMTNVLRTLGVWPALAVLVLDVGKGILAVVLAKIIDPSPSLEVAVALSVLVGHNWSIFLRFKGGKGSATGIGSFCALSPIAGLIMMAVGLPFIALFRYVSLGSIIGAVTAVVSMFLLALLAPSLPLGVSSLIYVLYPAIGAPIVLFKHRENIFRLMKGREHKLGESINVSDSPLGTSG